MQNDKSKFKILSEWVAKNRIEFCLLLAILIIGAFLRLHRIDEYMTFLGDEGRDVIIVRRFLTSFDIMLIGPGTSIGNMYLGPLYYYMMAPVLWLFNYSPVGPAVQIALLGVVTIFLVWYICRFILLGTLRGESLKTIALATAFLYTISPTVIIFSRSSWNPNIMPFFSLLFIWGIWEVWANKNFKWLLLLGGIFAFILNSHYLGLLMLPIFAVFWALIFRKLFKSSKLELRNFLKYSLFGALVFALLMSPLVIFDYRHNFQNFKAMQEFITHRDSSFKGLGEALINIWNVYENMWTRLPGGRNITVGRILALGSLAAFLSLAARKKLQKPFIIVVFWIVFGVAGLAFVEREIYDHYMGFLFPAPFLLLAGLAKDAESLKLKVYGNKIVNIFLVLAFSLMLYTALSNSPLKDNPSRQLERSKEVAGKIFEESKQQKINLAVLADSNYEDGYKYYLEHWGLTVLHADRWDPQTISDQLFVVCEREKSKCDPTHSPKAEIVNFGWTKVDNEWEIKGVVLYKLVHSQKNG